MLLFIIIIIEQHNPCLHHLMMDTFLSQLTASACQRTRLREFFGYIPTLTVIHRLTHDDKSTVSYYTYCRSMLFNFREFSISNSPSCVVFYEIINSNFMTMRPVVPGVRVLYFCKTYSTAVCVGGNMYLRASYQFTIYQVGRDRCYVLLHVNFKLSPVNTVVILQ